MDKHDCEADYADDAAHKNQQLQELFLTFLQQQQEMKVYQENNTKSDNKDSNNKDSTTDIEKEVEKKYKKNIACSTRITFIAGVLGGFAISSSEAMQENWKGTLDWSYIAYCSIIISAHVNILASVGSAILSRVMTRETDHSRSVMWMERHWILAATPWAYYVTGTTLFFLSAFITVPAKILSTKDAPDFITAILLGIISVFTTFGLYGTFMLYFRMDAK